METFTIDTMKRTFADSRLGEVKLKNAVLAQDGIEMYFDIEAFPEKVQRQIDETIKKKAIEEYYRDEERYKKHDITIENLKMEETCKLLCFECASGEIDLRFLIMAIDETKNLESEISIEANCEEFYDEIKNLIFKAIETIYFGQSRKKNVNQIS